MSPVPLSHGIRGRLRNSCMYHRLDVADINSSPAPAAGHHFSRHRVLCCRWRVRSSIWIGIKTYLLPRMSNPSLFLLPGVRKCVGRARRPAESDIHKRRPFKSGGEGKDVRYKPYRLFFHHHPHIFSSLFFSSGAPFLSPLRHLFLVLLVLSFRCICSNISTSLLDRIGLDHSFQSLQESGRTP